MFPNPEIFAYTIQWYIAWQITAIVISSLFAFYYLRKKKTVELSVTKLTLLIVGLLMFGYLGANIFSLLDYLTENGWEAGKTFVESFSIMGNGLRWYGTLLMILLMAPFIAKVLNIKNLPNGLDFIVLLLCLFTAVVKQACFFSGDGCYGVYTSLPWGMYFPYGEAPNILPVHPTPLYDSVFHLLLFALLLKVNKSKKFEGQTMLLFFAGTSLFNIALEFIRRNPEIALGLTLSQWTYIGILLLTIGYYFKFKPSNISFILSPVKHQNDASKNISNPTLIGK